MALTHPVPSQQHHEPPSDLLRLKLQATSWASQAKDLALASLHSQLLSALDSASASDARLSAALARNRALEHQAGESRARELALERQLFQMRARLQNVEAAEERLASEMGQLEAEAFEQAVHSNRLVSSISGRLEEKEQMLEELRRELHRLSTSGTDQMAGKEASPIAHGSQSLQILENKLAETESAWRKTESELQESKKNCGILQQKLADAEAMHRQLEKENKELLDTQQHEQHEPVSLKIEDLGIMFKFWNPSFLALRNQAVAPA